MMPASYNKQNTDDTDNHCRTDIKVPWCEWNLQNHNGQEYYETACDNTFIFFEDGLKENGFQYCPYCGRKIESEVARD